MNLLVRVSYLKRFLTITKRNSIAYHLAVLYLIILHLIQIVFLKIELALFRPFPVVEFLTIGVIIYLTFSSIKVDLINYRNSTLFFLISGMILYSLLSLIFYLQPGNPYSFQSFFYGVHNLVLPMILFYLVQKIKLIEIEKLLKYILFFNFVSCVLGLVLFIQRPEFYTEYLKTIFISKDLTETWQYYGRMQSYLGSTSVANIAMVSIILVSALELNLKVKSVYFIIFFISVIATQQRGPIVFMIFFLFAKFILNFTVHRLFISVVVIFISFSVAYYLINFSDSDILIHLISNLSDRILNETGPAQVFSERMIGYERASVLISDFPIGVGLGATLSASENAIGSGLGQVVDANYARILADLGFIGLFLFVVILVKAIVKSFELKIFHFSIIISFYAFHAVGTNIFDSFMCNHLFWLYLGIINLYAKSSYFGKRQQIGIHY